MLQQAIPFELHLTVSDLPQNRIESFVAFCLAQEAKPVLIELAQGEYIQQPMLTKVLYCKKFVEAQHASTTYQSLLHQEDFKVRRIKIEIPAYCATLGQWEIQTSFSPYFEWHGKISFERPEELLQLCENHQVHLSLNALKDAQEVRFVTLREYGSQSQFEARVAHLIQALRNRGWPIHKQQAEYCLLDNNIKLDQGWLPN